MIFHFDVNLNRLAGRKLITTELSLPKSSKTKQHTAVAFQDDLESLRHSSARDLASLASQLAKSEEERRHLADLVAVLRQRDSRDDSDPADSNQERKLLERRLEEAHLHLQDIKTSWSEKIASLETQVRHSFEERRGESEGGAFLQVGRLSRQAAEESAERRRAVEEKEALSESIRQMECELECNRLDLNNKESKIKRLTAEIEDLSREVKALRIESEEEVSFLRKQIVS